VEQGTTHTHPEDSMNSNRDFTTYVNDPVPPVPTEKEREPDNATKLVVYHDKRSSYFRLNLHRVHRGPTFTVHRFHLLGPSTSWSVPLFEATRFNAKRQAHLVERLQPHAEALAAAYMAGDRPLLDALVDKALA
jgi:hypothetical protein